MLMEKFWMEDISVLFRNSHLFPNSHLTLEENLNRMTKIVILVFFILFICNFKYDFVFLISILLFIIIYYYIYYRCLKHKEKEIIENYGKVDTVLQPPPSKIWNSYTNSMTFSNGSYPTSNCNSCHSDTSITNNKTPLYIPYYNNNISIFDTSQTTGYATQDIPLEETISTNQKLVGNPNPRTMVRPVIPNPIYDFSTWAPNDFVIPSSINDQKRQELYQNGYVSTEFYPPPAPPSLIESYSSSETPTPSGKAVQFLNYNNNQYNIPYTDSVNTSCGYQPSNIEYNLPINYRATSQQLTDEMKTYNDNLFSIPIQPNIYTSSQINQPYSSMSNLGISQDQPFLPTIPSYTDGILKFTEYDPKNVKPVSSVSKINAPLRNEIYDPRLTGYGTSYRHYIEKTTGQPRFYYDDIDQINQPNYITRNNLDIYGFGSQIGTPNEPSLEGDILRKNANHNYIDNQLLYRTELQQRLMHKNNNRAWQQRQAPINTYSRAFKSNGTMSGAFN